MKKILSCLLTAFILLSCEIDQSQEIKDKVDVSFGIAMSNTGSRSFSALVNPKIAYTIKTGTEIYMSAENVPVIETAGVYTVEISLEAGATYEFTQFTVKDDINTQVYILDEVKTTSFVVDAAGVVTPNPAQIYLKYQLKDEFTDTLEDLKGFVFVDDFKLAENLTFKVEIPAGLTVSVEHAGSFGTDWSKIDAPILLNNEDIFDMDTRTIAGATTVSNDDSAITYAFYNTSDATYYSATTGVTDNFRFKITKGSGADMSTYYIYFNSAKYNKKRIKFNVGS